MRLDGSLEDFTLPDILQLLAHTRKTGSLQLSAAHGERRGVVRLTAGSITGASSDLRRHALARRLVGAGLVSDEALTAAADDVREGAPSLVRALLDRSDAPPAVVSQLACDQVTDAVCELLRWSAGTFSFLVGDPDLEGFELSLSADDLVAEGDRRMQVWPTLTSHIPTPDTVLRLAASPSFDPSCSREEWGLLALVDGKRSVSEIVALLGRSEFAVAGALSALVERGLLTSESDGSGLADLQRRQDVIAALEDPVAAAPMVAAVEPAPEAPAFEVPLARSEAPEYTEASESSEAPEYSAFAALLDEPSNPVVSSPTPMYDQLLTEGSAALDPAHDPSESPVLSPVDPSARGLDSAVTKSLVLRLIAGVRGL